MGLGTNKPRFDPTLLSQVAPTQQERAWLIRSFSLLAPPNDTCQLPIQYIILPHSRFVNRDDKPVKLCCLFPNVKDYTATLMMVEMPFSNQIK